MSPLIRVMFAALVLGATACASGGEDSSPVASSTGETCGLDGQSIVVEGPDAPDSRCAKQSQKKDLPDVWCCQLGEPATK
jgi:hypothetical protein